MTILLVVLVVLVVLGNLTPRKPLILLGFLEGHRQQSTALPPVKYRFWGQNEGNFFRITLYFIHGLKCRCGQKSLYFRRKLIFWEHASISINALDKLEQECGTELFRKLFKTITVDNGTEFADAEGIAASIDGSGTKRTKVYYCHPYSSWERGSNEVTNKMIRRKVPKGSNFDNKTEEEIRQIEHWINNYPRKLHDYHSAAERFEEEFKKLAWQKDKGIELQGLTMAAALHCYAFICKNAQRKAQVYSRNNEIERNAEKCRI